MKQKNSDKPKTRDAAFTREGVVEIVTRAAEGDKPETKSVRLSVSSEEPYLKWVWDEDAKDWVRGYEVLGHGADEIDFSRMKGGLVIQDGHYGKQIGIIDEPEVKDGKLGGVVRFGHSPEAKYCEADALDGIRKNMSVGYFVKEYKRDGVAEDGYPIFRAVKWTPFEGSFVNVPADVTVGVGRSATDTTEPNGGVPTANLTQGDEMTKEEIEAAIRKGMVDQNVTLSEEEIKQIVDLMMKVKAMGIDYKVLAEQADDIYAKYKDDIKAGTFDINKVDINDLGLTKIIGNAITDTAKNIGNSIAEFFTGLFK